MRCATFNKKSNTTTFDEISVELILIFYEQFLCSMIICLFLSIRNRETLMGELVGLVQINNLG